MPCFKTERLKWISPASQSLGQVTARVGLSGLPSVYRPMGATSISISARLTVEPTTNSDATILRNTALPDFNWARLRKEAPGQYESYVDLEPGVWTKYKIEVEGRKARLYVNGAEQPCLIVNDLKLEPREGRVALWVGPGTEGYFANLKITRKPQGGAGAEIENLMQQLYRRGQFNGAVLVARHG